LKTENVRPNDLAWRSPGKKESRKIRKESNPRLHSQAKGKTMSITDSLLAAGGGGLINQLAGRVGINSEQATSAVSVLLPMLAGGMKERIANKDPGLTSLLTSTKMTQYAGDLSSLDSPAAANAGNDLISRIFSPGDASKMIATVAEKVGLGGDTIGKILPILATFLGSYVSKSVANGGNLTDTLDQFSESGILAAVKGLASKVFG
jgi:hypothetical protein